MPRLADKISQAKAKLLVDYPLFGTIASRLTLVQNDDIQAFKSDGNKVEYNGDFFEGLSIGEMEFVFANGAMHASLAHEMRKNGRSGWLWQMATDLAVNDMLVENKMELPYGAQYRVRFKGMYAEEIYAQLQDDILREDEDLEYEADDAGDVQNNNNEKKTQEQLQEEILQEQLFGEEMLGVLISKEKQGDAPKAIERFFKLQRDSKIDWRNELKVAIERFHKDDYILIPPNKKFLYTGVYLPSCISNTLRLVIAVDSSGSVDETLLNTFLSEINFLMEVVPNYQIDMLVCDDTIRSHTVFYSGETLECRLKGGGGTDFRPVFEFIENELHDTKLLLYFTDLEGIFAHAKPSYEVKWISPKVADVPFGELVLLQE